MVAALFALLGLIGLQSPGLITGTISDVETGAPIAGATVIVVETGVGVVTPRDGRYSLTGTGLLTLAVSHVGYQSATRVVDFSADATAIDLSLARSTAVLGGVLVEQASMTGGLLGLKGLPGSAHLVSTRSLDRFAQTDIHRALRAVPGVSIQEEDGFGLRPNIGIRGSGSERSSKITVMEDGVLVAPAPYSAPAAYYFPTTGRLSGIEVVKGASQIRFGPNTTGGALNLLSTPIPTRKSGDLTLLAGDHDNRLFHGFGGAEIGRVGFLLETHQQRSDGFKELDFGGATGFDKRDYLAKFRIASKPHARVQQSLLFKVGIAEETSEETYLGLTATDFQTSPSRRYLGSSEDRMVASHRLLMLRHRILPASGMELVTTAYATSFDRNWYKLDAIQTAAGSVKIGTLLESPEAFPGAYGVVTGTSREGVLDVKANNRAYLSRGLQMDGTWERGAFRVETGLRAHYDEMDRFQWVDKFQVQAEGLTLTTAGIPGTESNRIESSHAAASYVQATLEVGRLSILPGLRYETVVQRREDYGKADPERVRTDLRTRRNASKALLPGIGLTYRQSPYLSAFLGVHRGFAPPGTTEGTRPENSVNLEVGARYQRGPSAIEVVAFRSDYTNLLGSDLAAFGGAGSSEQFNAGEALVQGVEFSASYNLGGAFGWIASVPVSLAWTHTAGTFSSDFESTFGPWGTVSSGDQLPYLAKNQVNATLAWEERRWDAALTGFWTSPSRTSAGNGPIPEEELVDAHFTLDLSVEASIGAGVRAFLVVRNLTDEVYVAARRPAGLRPGLPRSLLAGLKASF